MWHATLGAVTTTTTPAKGVLPSRVKAERERQHMSREQLGVKAGLSGRTVARIESADHSPRFETITRIARALDVDPVDLLTADIPLEAAS